MHEEKPKVFNFPFSIATLMGAVMLSPAAMIALGLIYLPKFGPSHDLPFFLVSIVFAIISSMIFLTSATQRISITQKNIIVENIFGKTTISLADVKNCEVTGNSRGTSWLAIRLNGGQKEIGYSFRQKQLQDIADCITAMQQP